MSSPRPTRWIRAFHWSERWLERFARVLRIAHEGFWLGWFDSDELTLATVASYNRENPYATRAHNLSGLFQWEHKVVTEYFGSGFRILVAAAGAGRELVALNRLGYRADGFDCSIALVGAGQRLIAECGLDASLSFCPPAMVPDSTRHCDGIIVGWGGYTHIPGTARRVEFLRQLHRVVSAGAPVLLSFWARPDPAAPDDYRVLKLASHTRALRRSSDEPPQLGDHLTGIGFDHRFTRSEIEAEFAAAGFRLEAYSETDHPYAVGLALGEG